MTSVSACRPERSPARSEGGDQGFGVYVHIPFCARRCDYCAFATWTDRHHLIDPYVEAVVTDISRAVTAGMPPASSVFVGGGTPTLLPASALARILAAIPVTNGVEVTVEANPDTVEPTLTDALAAAGVNRMSLGVQSMVPHVLEALGRTHDPAHVTRAVAAVRASGITSFNLDLIYGVAGETLDDWRRTLDAALALDPPHLSAYALTVEAGTPLAADWSRHPDDDDQADKYLAADEVLTAAGLGWYEISNWARPGHRCRHNHQYWSQGEYQGFGCAAHSHRDSRRYWNVRTPERYQERIARGRSPEAGAEQLDPAARRLEGLQLALRTVDGVPATALVADGPDGLAPGLITVVEDRAVLTRRGRLLANEVALRLR